MTPGADERIYPAAKLAAVIEALVSEGVQWTDALRGTGLSQREISLPETRVSVNQLLASYNIASRSIEDASFAYRTGLRFHLSTYGIYGFAILSSTDFRQTMRFAVDYHRLASPTTEIVFSEQDGAGVWTISPALSPRVDQALYRFIVELQIGVHVSLQRDVMGPTFRPLEIRLAYGAPSTVQQYADMFGCKVVVGEQSNQLIFDAQWLDQKPLLGNEITYGNLTRLCDELLHDLHLQAGIAGKARQILLRNLARPPRFDALAKSMAMTPRTLHRRLGQEGTSYRALVDQLRMNVAMKYLRETQLTVDEISTSLGFSEPANFRHAFHRWTNKAPQDFRRAQASSTP